MEKLKKIPTNLLKKLRRDQEKCAALSLILNNTAEIDKKCYQHIKK